MYFLSKSYRQIALSDSIASIYAKFEVLYFGSNNDTYSYNWRDGIRRVAAANQEPDSYGELAYYYHSDHLGSTSYVTDANGAVSQHVEYVPFGEVFIEERNNTWNTPYLFNAKELDEETGLYYYGARYCDPRTSLWLSTDPMELKYPNISTYAYCANNPINAIDPNGMNPIYDINGNFLGTDDKGIAGSYVIMNKNDFVQGMSHKSALEKQYLNAIENDARQKIWDHHATLDTRPDYDGYVSISEGVDWAKSHPGALQNPTPNNTLYVDASKLNFSSISTSDFVQEGKETSVNLFSLKSFVLDFLSYDRRNTVYALGRVDLILLSREHRTIKIVNNEATDYDWNVGGGKYRNLFINLERGRTGLEDNHGFKVFYYGIGKLNE